MIVVVILMFVAVVLFARIKIRLMSFVNLLENKGFFGLRLFSFPLLSGKIFLRANNIILALRKKEIEVHLNADISDSKSVVSYLRKPLIKSATLERLHFFAETGYGTDAFVSAIMAGIGAVLSKIMLAVLKNRNPRASIMSNITPIYNKDEIEMTFDGIFSFSVADIIIGLIKELIKSERRRISTRRKTKYRQKKAKQA